ncbi:MAG TPA: GH92 family glycosyl hydrolase [Thermoleophilaceae bacterium]|jgi:predicted alpha-1,2-mannosidase
MRRLTILTAAILALAAAPAGAQLERDLVSYVDPMIGTAPPGFVFPGAAVPFGMVQNSPDTRGEFAYSGYLHEDPQIQGFSLVHLSGPGVKKAGDIPFMPTVGPVVSNDPNVYGSPYDHAQEEALAGLYRVRLDKYATDVELTASTHAAMQRYTFPPSPQSNVIIDVARSVEGVHDGQIRFSGKDEVTGFARGRYPVYFVAKFDRPFASTGAFKTDGNGAGGWVTFDTTTGGTAVTARIGISFVDLEGARRNLEAEAPTFDFAGMAARAREAWNRELGRVRVSGGTDLERTTFYTALYHAQLHPNVFTDVDGRYLGFDGKVHRAEGRIQYANFSGWDTYKGENQLLATLQPRRYRDMLLTLLANHREGGRLPRWGEQNFDAAHMSGDPIVPMIADGACREILARDDAKALLDASIALAAKRDPSLAKLGYLPDRPGTTLEYGGADFALALLADALGDRGEAARRRADSLRYRSILDPSTRWIRPRHADGSWQEPFDPTEETGFQEGNSWQYSWLAPHDARGLYDRMGGDGPVVERLDQFFAGPPEVQNQATFFGIVYRLPQYAPGNEHDLQAPWMYPFAGQPWKTMSEHRDIQRVFRPEPFGLPGNDDLGGLSGWLVWSMLGIGPVTPGAPFHVLGSPVFEKAELRPDGAAAFTIEAPGASPLRPYVTAATLGGRKLGSAWLYDASLRRGETLRLTTAVQPDQSFGSAPAVRPPSASDSALDRFGCVGPAAAERAGDPASPAPGAGDPARAPVEPGPVRADGSAPPALVPLRLRVSPRVARSGVRTDYRLTVHAKRGGKWRVVPGARVRLAGIRARTNRKGVAIVRTRIWRVKVHAANATAAAARPARASIRVVPRRRQPPRRR